MVQDYKYNKQYRTDPTDDPTMQMIQYTGTKENIADIMRFVPVGKVLLIGGICIRTPFGLRIGEVNEYIIHATDGEFYVLPKEVAEGYYELA